LLYKFDDLYLSMHNASTEYLPTEPFHWGWQWQTRVSCWWSVCSIQTAGGHSSTHPVAGALPCSRKKINYCHVTKIISIGGTFGQLTMVLFLC
jgi:hypothetical protein